jgi:L-threonylcarbamoyladenylate synthase
MITRYIAVNPEYPEPQAIAEAAAVIRGGGTVAFPTETVYGLGANGLDPAAVERIFVAKGRPWGNPLILHVASTRQARRLVAAWPDGAESLAARFWPGPLTLILPRSAGYAEALDAGSRAGSTRPKGTRCLPPVPDIVTAGLDTVALRMPAHPVALALIERSGLPIAAPSANSSGRPSPTLAEHVRADLDGRIDLVLDGGATAVGVESTIIDLSGGQPLLLRPGGITREALEQVMGTVVVHETARPGAVVVTDDTELAPCPGTLYRHYAPQAEAIVVAGDAREQQAKVRGYLAAHPGKRVALLATAENAPAYWRLMEDASGGRDGRPAAPIHVEALGSRSRPEEIAAHIFGALRNCDQAGAEVILMESVPLSGMGLAVMNRLYRAAANRAI